MHVRSLVSEVLELKAGDSLRDAIHTLYEKDVFSAAIVDMDSDAVNMTFSDQYIGLVDFTSMVLWCLEVLPFYLWLIPPPKCHAILITHGIWKEYEKITDNLKSIKNGGFFSVLDQIPQIGQTKVSCVFFMLPSLFEYIRLKSTYTSWVVD